jgi:hypothetical protein
MHKTHSRIQDEDILHDPPEMKLAQFKQKLLNSVSRMEDIRYPNQLLDCGFIGRRGRIIIRRPGDR